MKKRITKGFLWSVILFEIIALLVVFLLYILSDPQTLKYAVDRATKNLDIQYDTISGNFLKTMSVKNLRYKGALLAKEAIIDWNLRALVRGKIEIETLSLKEVNLKSIETILTKNKKSHKTSHTPKKLSIPEISISHLFLSTLPYHSDILDIKRFELEVYDVETNLKHITIKEFAIEADTNLAYLKTDGEIKSDTLHLGTFYCQNLHAQHIEKVLKSYHSDNNKTTPFTLFDKVKIDNLHIDVNPYQYQTYHINQLSIDAKEFTSSINKLQIQSKKLHIKSETNLLSFTLDGTIFANILKGKSSINLSQKYLKRFTNIVDFNSLNPIHVTLKATPTQIDAKINLKSRQVFAGRFKDYLTQINNLESLIHYDIKQHTLRALTDANISSKYAKTLQLKDNLIFDGNLSYKGSIAISKLQHFPHFSLPLFEDAIIHYSADTHNLTANLVTKKLHLLYQMYDYKRADFNLSSKKIDIKDYLSNLPSSLQQLQANIDASMSLDFHHPLPLNIKTDIYSNALDIKGNTIITANNVLAKTKASLSKNSLLSALDKNIKLQNIFPATLEIGYHDKNLSLLLKSKFPSLQNSFNYDINGSIITDRLSLGDETILLRGTSDKLHLQSHILSLKTAQEKLSSFYNFTLRPYDGEIDINATMKDLQNIDANIYSRWLVYEYKPYHFAFAEKVGLNLQINDDLVVIPHYQFNTYLDYDRVFYATKPSKIHFLNDKIELLSLWVNDGLNTTGGYDFSKKAGVFHSKAIRYHYKGREGNLYLSTNIDTTLSKNHTHIEGAVNLLEGVITYEHKKTHNIQDPDIIIIQEEEQKRRAKEAKKSALSLDIAISSQKPLTYKVPKVDVKITPDVKIWKENHKELELLGRLIVHQGIYTENSKEFNILGGEILFGGEILNPYLNIRAEHTSQPYVITIDITGTLDAPIVNFSSDPYLSQSDILSMLLFSTTTESLFESGGNSSNQAISMLGNTFAKEIVKNFGLSLDKLVLTTNQEGGLGIEIGKKISKKITVIYINDIVQSIKVRYQNSDNFETDLMLSPESSGIDFLYKSEH